MTIRGTVSFFDAEQGYGRITPQRGGHDSYVGPDALRIAGISTLSKGNRVRYDLSVDNFGKLSVINLEFA